MIKRFSIIILVLTAFGAGWGLAKYRISPAATVQPEAAVSARPANSQADPLDGYVAAGHMTTVEDGREYLSMTWIRRGDRRGWKWDQTYYDADGRFVKAVEQWCVHGGDAYIVSSDRPGVRKIGPCGSPGLAGRTNVQQAIYAGEPVIVSSVNNAQFTSDQLVSVRIGLPLKIAQKFTNGDTSLLETTGIQYKALPDDILKVPAN